MQTGIHDCPQGNLVGVANWKKLVLNNAELIAAIEANRVEAFVREALAPLYGRYKTFHLIVAEILRSILFSIAHCVQYRNRHDLSTVINHTRLETAEVDYCKRLTEKTGTTYWAGEKCYESGTD